MKRGDYPTEFVALARICTLLRRLHKTDGLFRYA